MKYDGVQYVKRFNKSHPVRGAWVEIGRASPRTCPIRSHPVRGAWVEIVQ